jgi:lipid-A-disaccharide synthase
MLRIGIVAGEESGDLLGANLIEAVKEKISDVEIVGIGGDHLTKAGCKTLYPMEKLSVMGIVEVCSRYFELLSIRNDLKKYFLDNPPDVFIGVDAPDFNFSLERALRKAGIKTVHYVSPSIWAWREYRLKMIAHSVDLMLTLFPFEVDYYTPNNIQAVFVGHPLAEKINFKTDKNAARDRLALPTDKRIIAIMPGSRKNELDKLAEPFIHTAARCKAKKDDLYFIAGLTNDNMGQIFSTKLKQIAPNFTVKVITGKSLDVMEAADVILLASGTVALEAMLLKRPMVVAYKLNIITYEIAKRLVRIPYISLPNILAKEIIVPECLQSQCTPELLCDELMKWIDNERLVNQLEQKFLEIHQKIRAPSRQLVRTAILDLINA